MQIEQYLLTGVGSRGYLISKFSLCTMQIGFASQGDSY